MIRLGHDRRLKKGRGRDGHPKLNEVLGSGPARFTRRVRLGRREREVATKKQKIFPEREPRSSLLEIRAKAINLHRAHQHSEHLPDSRLLNFVEVKEVGAPAGTTPVVWRLVTTEPIATERQVAEAIDIYRKWWIVEEFFKAIKTDCRFESHQVEDIKGLLVALVIESAVAWQILRLRHVARSQPSAPGRTLLTRLQFETLNRLRALRGQRGDSLSVQQVIDELARLGVHPRNNGPPGWAVLKRGLRKLNLLAEGFNLADPAIPTGMRSIFRQQRALTPEAATPRVCVGFLGRRGWGPGGTELPTTPVPHWNPAPLHSGSPPRPTQARAGGRLRL